MEVEHDPIVKETSLGGLFPTSMTYGNKSDGPWKFLGLGIDFRMMVIYFS